MGRAALIVLVFAALLVGTPSYACSIVTVSDREEVEWWAGKSDAVYIGVVDRVNWRLIGMSGEAAVKPSQTLKGRAPKAIKVPFDNAPWVCGRDLFKRGEKVVVFALPEKGGGPLVFHLREVDMNSLRSYLAPRQ